MYFNQIVKYTIARILLNIYTMKMTACFSRNFDYLKFLSNKFIELVLQSHLFLSGSTISVP